MIKFMMTSAAGRKILGIMISDGNVERLTKEQPIHFHAEQMGLTEIKCNEIIILHFSTEEAFREAFEKGGLITENTIIHETEEKIQ